MSPPLPQALPRPLLFSFRRCPYAIRARMALHQAAIDFDVHEVSLRAKPAALLALSPKGTVPVLQLPDGTVFEHSLDIMRWALAQHDPAGWLSAGDAQATEDWITRNDLGFKPLLDRYKYAERHAELSREAHRAAALQHFISPLDQVLRDKTWLLGQRASLADVAVFPFVRQFAMVEPAWFATAPLPGVQAWLATWLGSALFAAVMAKPLQGREMA